MKNNKHSFIAAMAAIVFCFAAAGCSDTDATTTKKTSSGQSLIASNTAYTTSEETAEDSSEDTVFSDRDLEQTADTSDAQTITVSDGETIDITEEGIYIITGTASDCTIKVNADGAKVQLVLDNVSITNSDFPAVYVVSADKCFITTADGSTNSLSVTGQFTADGDTNTDAVIFSKDDLVLNGEGSLEILSAYGNGITSKDDLKATGGTYSIKCAEDALEANDSILVGGGDFTIVTDKDALHAENDEDDSQGYIYISGGNFDITAGSDGIQGTSFVQIDGGNFTINSAEGIEATYIQINDGSINITATDDGINAAQKSSAYDVMVEINGGEVTVSMGQGDTDAIDSNGSVVVNGGTVNITAPTESFDYDMSAEFNGGTIIINGEEVSEIPTPRMGGGMGGFSGHGGRGGFADGEQFGGFGQQNGTNGMDGQSGQNGGFGGHGGRHGGNFSADSTTTAFGNTQDV